MTELAKRLEEIVESWRWGEISDADLSVRLEGIIQEVNDDKGKK